MRITASLRDVAAVAVLVAGLAAGAQAQAASWQHYEAKSRTPSSCPNYVDYSQKRHEPYSSGQLKLPFMRPSEECRTFKSPAVEKVIQDMKSRIKDPDLARLFENTFPSALDTTVKYFDPKINLAFILLPQDRNLGALIKAVINTESRYLAEYPYCGSFQPPPESGLKPTVNDYAVKVSVNPPVDSQIVFECKWELDSLAGFLKISRSYYQNTKDTSFINKNWENAMNKILQTIVEQSQSSWSKDWEFVSYFNWTGTPGSLSPPVPNGGNGEPKLGNGLVASSHRPSDDLCVFSFITPVNAMLAVELGHIADMLDNEHKLSEISRKVRHHAGVIRKAVLENTKTANGIFAYETNGYGGQYIMDDANVPSLVSLPYLGFLPRNDDVYKKTKDAMFSPANPYFAKGKNFQGIGGPHVSATHPWPMSQVSGIFGTDDDEEIKRRLALILENTSGLGLIHESVHVHNTSDFTRPWFVWVNSYFAEMMLDLAERKPGLIFKDKTPYVVGKSGN
ncbi:hypothetical protein EsHS_00007345 [Epichloe bromicola]